MREKNHRKFSLFACEGTDEKRKNYNSAAL